MVLQSQIKQTDESSNEHIKHRNRETESSKLGKNSNQQTKSEGEEKDAGIYQINGLILDLFETDTFVVAHGASPTEGARQAERNREKKTQRVRRMKEDSNKRGSEGEKSKGKGREFLHGKEKTKY